MLARNPRADIVNNDTVLFYFPEKIKPSNAKQFSDICEVINTSRAAQFWGVEEQASKLGIGRYNPLTHNYPTPRNRIITIKNILGRHEAPNSPYDEYINTVTKTQPQQIIKKSKDTLAKAIPIKNKKPGAPKITFCEAHSNPVYREAAFDELAEQQNPVLEVLLGLEYWRQRYAGSGTGKESIDFSKHNIIGGFAVFDALLLFSPKTPYAEALGRAATQHLL